ncbi:MAG: Hpt domain-containing protein, partial [Pseudomonadota bacterium]
MDWIKSDLIETLNQARVALDDYAEGGADETRLRVCLTNLHQLHGTLLMLELEGVTLLADHLEQLAQALLSGKVAEPAPACQLLMQGILEMPGYLDELQRGAEDNVGIFVQFVNELRAQLEQEPLSDVAGASLIVGASDEVIDRFVQLDGQEKVGRMRSAYQSVLLSILKGEERSQAIVTLSKIGAGLERLTEGASVQRQWQAFGEFVTSLGGESGALDSGSVRLLRRVDLELKALMVDGAEALRRPANVELVEELLDAAQAENYTSDAVEGLRAAVNRDSSNNTLAISGRQALATAAIALRDELSVIKDKLDLLSRSEPLDMQALAELNQPLKQMGSTLSLLGFESSREIVADQIENIDRFVAVDDADAASVQGVAAALMQIDENLASVSVERNESEQITGEAHLQLLREARRGLDVVKTSIVDFVTANWDVVHLQQLPEIVREVCGALDMVQLPKITGHLRTLGEYIDDRLLKGHKPDWQELDVFADAVSGADYYLERLTDEHAMGTEDILQLVERSVSHLMNGFAAQSDDTVPTSDSSAVTAAELVDDNDESNHAAADSVEPDQTDVQDVALASTVQRATAEFDLEDLLNDSPVEGVVATEAAPQEDSTEEDLAAASPAEETLLEDASTEADFSEQIAPQDLAADAMGADLAAAETADTSLEETAAEDAIPEDLVEEAAAVEDFDLDILDAEPAGSAAMVGANDDREESPDALTLEPTAELDDAASLGDEQANAAAGADTFDLDAFAELDALPDVRVSEDTTPAVDVSEPQPPATVVPDIPRPDPEILEIFEEEVGEVLEAIDEHLPQWAATLTLGEPLTELRRAFHTLKGSGRIVSAAEIGELAWGIENMLNRVIDETVSANGDFVQVVSEARQLMEPLCEAFIAAEPGDLTACSAVIERADLLASGSDLPAEVRAEATPPTQEPLADATGDAASAATEDAAAETADEVFAASEAVDDDDAFSLEDLELLDALGLDDLDEDPASPTATDMVAEPAPDPDSTDSEQFALEDLDLELQTEPVDGADDGSETDTEPDAEPAVLDEDLALFLSEMDDHVGVLVSANAQQPWRMSEGLIRALHTLAGTAATAGVEGVRFVVEPANQVVAAYRGLPETTEQEEFFQAVQQALQAMQGYLQKGESWEDPVEIVAAADDLIETALTRSNPLQELLQSQATDVAFTAELDLPMILDGKIEAQDVVPALEELSELAARADQSDLNRLAKVLAEKMQLAITQAPVDQVSSELLQNGFAMFIAGLNELAVGSSAHVPADIVSGLQDMQMSSAQPIAVDDSETEAADAVPADTVAPVDRELSLDSLLDDVVQDIAATGETPELDADDDLEFASDVAADLEFQAQQTAASDDLAAAVDELSALEGELKEFEPLADDATAAEENVSEVNVSEELVAEESGAEEPALGEAVQDESLAPADVLQLGQETESAAEAQDDDDSDRTTQVEVQVEADAEHVASVDDLTEVDPDLVDVFFDEADEICEELEANILEWSQAWENRIHQENMLRGLHTLKGGARLCGLSRLGDMAHDFESLVIEVQNDERPIDEGLFKNLHENYDGLLTCLAGLRASLYSADEDAAAADSADDADALLTSELADDQATALISNDDEAGRDLGVPAPASALQAVPGGQVVLSDLKPGTEEPATEATVEAPKVERPQQEMVRVGAALLENLVNLAGENSIQRAGEVAHTLLDTSAQNRVFTRQVNQIFQQRSAHSDHFLLRSFYLGCFHRRFGSWLFG